tara:strand:+ start:1752 stop:2099 length:348 start_codon:yes stop_codon:yes gene_type:complete
MRFISRFLWLVITVIAVVISMAFAASNDSVVTLFLWPFKTGLSLPIWLVAQGAFGMGVVAGGLIVWLSTIAIRARSWRAEKKLEKMEKRMNCAETQLANAEKQINNNAAFIPSKR